MSQSGTQHWSNYWSNGFLTSLPEDFSANYDGEIAEFWADQFARLPNPASMLDVCTGNGAIAWLAASWALDNQHDLLIRAADAASIDPAAQAQGFSERAAGYSQLEFMPETPVEDIVLPDHSLDLVTSHYGFEYCEWPVAAARLVPLLKPGGRLVLLAHCGESELMATMVSEETRYGLLDTFGYFEFMDRLLSQEWNALQVAQRLNALGTRIFKAYHSDRAPLYKTTLDVLSSLRQADDAALQQKLPGLSQYHENFLFARARLMDMLRVNRALIAEPEWYRVFVAEGLDLTGQGSIHYQGKHHSGNYYCFEKPHNGTNEHG